MNQLYKDPVLCRSPGLPNIVQKEMIFTFFLGQTAFVTGKKFVGRVLTPGPQCGHKF